MKKDERTWWRKGFDVTSYLGKRYVEWWPFMNLEAWNDDEIDRILEQLWAIRQNLA